MDDPFNPLPSSPDDKQPLVPNISTLIDFHLPPLKSQLNSLMFRNMSTRSSKLSRSETFNEDDMREIAQDFDLQVTVQVEKVEKKIMQRSEVDNRVDNRAQKQSQLSEYQVKLKIQKQLNNLQVMSLKVSRFETEIKNCDSVMFKVIKMQKDQLASPFIQKQLAAKIKKTKKPKQQ